VARGFTLVELLVVLAVMAAVLAIAVPVVGTAVPGLAFKSSVRDVATALRASRSEAIVGNRETAFVLDLATRAYVVTGREPRRLRDDIDIAFVTARSEMLGETAGVIRFFPDGSSTGGRVTLTRAERSYHVDVDWLTGRVAIWH